MHPERNIPSLDRKEPTIHFDKTYSVYEAMCRPRLKSNYNVARRFGKIKDDLKTAEE